MAKLSDIERREKIIQFVIKNGKAKVAELADIFQVSTETIRKDLNYLHSKNILHKGHGIVLPASAYQENLFARKADKNQSEKTKIAMLAETLIPPEGVIYLDASSTVMQLAMLLNHHQNLTIVTNSLSSAQVLVSGNNHIMVTGGELRHKSYAYIGQWTERAIKQVHFDMAFFGCDGFHKQGPAIRAYPELAVKECAIAQTNKSILLADSSKLAFDGLYSFATFSQIDVLITDRALSQEEQKIFPKDFTVLYPDLEN